MAKPKLRGRKQPPDHLCGRLLTIVAALKIICHCPNLFFTWHASENGQVQLIGQLSRYIHCGQALGQPAGDEPLHTRAIRQIKRFSRAALVFVRRLTIALGEDGGHLVHHTLHFVVNLLRRSAV